MNNSTTLPNPALDELRIVEWWSDCNTDDDRELESGFCGGNLYAISEPIQIDQTGETCYINPALPGEINHVFWFGPGFSLDAPDKLYVYDIQFTGTNSSAVAEFLPTDCSNDGVCSCGALEPIRNGWANASSTSFCESDLSTVDGAFFCGAGIFEINAPTECASSSVFSVNETSYCSPLNGRIDKLATTPVPTMSPTTTISSTTASSSGAIALWCLVGASIGSFW